MEQFSVPLNNGCLQLNDDGFWASILVALFTQGSNEIDFVDDDVWSQAGRVFLFNHEGGPFCLHSLRLCNKPCGV